MKILHVLFLTTAKPDDFNDEDAEIASVFGDLCAIALKKTVGRLICSMKRIYPLKRL